jgi:tRNA(fMet)-specific endonuclease VapC
MICLDSSVFIEHFRSRNKKETLFTKLSDKPNLFVTTITSFEIYRGGKDQIPCWEMVFDRMKILPFDEGASKIASELYLQLKSKNRLIGQPYLFIAAIALNNNLTLATHDLRCNRIL